MTSPTARRLPLPSSVWEADSHPSKITLLHSLSSCKTLASCFAKTQPLLHRRRGAFAFGGALWFCDAPSSPEHRASPFASPQAAASPFGLSAPPNTSYSSSLEITAARGVSSGSPSCFPSQGECLQRADESCWGCSGGPGNPQGSVTWAFVQLPGLSYVSLTEPHTLANGWPDAIVIPTGEDGV